MPTDFYIGDSDPAYRNLLSNFSAFLFNPVDDFLGLHPRDFWRCFASLLLVLLKILFKHPSD